MCVGLLLLVKSDFLKMVALLSFIMYLRKKLVRERT
jgi:hypothetical protein